MSLLPPSSRIGGGLGSWDVVERCRARAWASQTRRTRIAGVGVMAGQDVAGRLDGGGNVCSARQREGNEPAAGRRRTPRSSQRQVAGVQGVSLTRVVLACVCAGGKLRYLTVKKAAAAPKCGDCHIALPGVRPHTNSLSCTEPLLRLRVGVMLTCAIAINCRSAGPDPSPAPVRAGLEARQDGPARVRWLALRQLRPRAHRPRLPRRGGQDCQARALGLSLSLPLLLSINRPENLSLPRPPPHARTKNLTLDHYPFSRCKQVIAQQQQGKK